MLLVSLDSGAYVGLVPLISVPAIIKLLLVLKCLGLGSVYFLLMVWVVVVTSVYACYFSSVCWTAVPDYRFLNFSFAFGQIVFHHKSCEPSV